jgi:hypothetical protein
MLHNIPDFFVLLFRDQISDNNFTDKFSQISTLYENVKFLIINHDEIKET